jgi:hypothetical protein
MKLLCLILKNASSCLLWILLMQSNVGAQTTVLDLKQVYEAALQQDASIRA